MFSAPRMSSSIVSYHLLLSLPYTFVFLSLVLHCSSVRFLVSLSQIFLDVSQEVFCVSFRLSQLFPSVLYLTNIAPNLFFSNFFKFAELSNLQEKTSQEQYGEHLHNGCPSLLIHDLPHLSVTLCVSNFFLEPFENKLQIL